jgi:hypothetical protein
MADRNLPVRPDLDQLRHQAKDLLGELRQGALPAVAAMQRHHPRQPPPDPAEIKLAAAQLVLARSYGLPSWPRLILACRMTDAIWRDDVDAVRELVTSHPRLLHENARGVASNWGPPMTYAANLGRDRIIAMLRGLGAADLQSSFDRACLQGQIETAKVLQAMGARPDPDAVMAPCETLNADGLAFLLGLGVPLADGHGDRLAPIALLLET